MPALVLTIVQKDQVTTILAGIVRSAQLDKAGHGMAFVVPVSRILGVLDSMKP